MDGQRSMAITALVEEHYALLYRFAYRLAGSSADAEDLVQQAYLTAQTKVDQLREPAKARSWLMTIVLNAFRKSRRRDRPVAFSTMEHEPQPSVEPAAETIDAADEMQAALAALDEDYRVPLVLFYFEEFNYKQIAELLEIPVGTVMSRLSRGKGRLREWYRRTHPEVEALTGG